MVSSSGSYTMAAAANDAAVWLASSAVEVRCTSTRRSRLPSDPSERAECSDAPPSNVEAGPSCQRPTTAPSSNSSPSPAELIPECDGTEHNLTVTLAGHGLPSRPQAPMTIRIADAGTAAITSTSTSTSRSRSRSTTEPAPPTMTATATTTATTPRSPTSTTPVPATPKAPKTIPTTLALTTPKTVTNEFAGIVQRAQSASANRPGATTAVRHSLCAIRRSPIDARCWTPPRVAASERFRVTGPRLHSGPNWLAPGEGDVVRNGVCAGHLHLVGE